MLWRIVEWGKNASHVYIFTFAEYKSPIVLHIMHGQPEAALEHTSPA